MTAPAVKAIHQQSMANELIYLDYGASTPVDPRVRDAMLPWLGECFGNPHSANHEYGLRAEAAVELARGQVAALIGAAAEEIIFTSGATEANNLAIKGLARFHARQGAEKRHIITLATEHRSVLNTCESLRDEGFEVTVLPVGADGLLDLALLENAIRADTLLVSVMAVNNEIGVIQPIQEIGRICRDNDVHFHCDAAQAFGKIPLDVEAMAIDLLSVSGHKIYAPQGAGALYVRRRPRVRLEPLFSGGGQERGLRSGTLSVPLAVALGEAAAIAAAEMDAESVRLRGLRDRFIERLAASGCAFEVNGSMEWRVAGNLSLGFPHVEKDTLMAAIPELALSAGSACSTGRVSASHVLQALGSTALTVLRIGFGRFTTEQEALRAADILSLRLRTLALAA